jgi:hypothetical protein
VLLIQLAESRPSVAITDIAGRLSDEIYPVPMLALEVDYDKIVKIITIHQGSPFE